MRQGDDYDNDDNYDGNIPMTAGMGCRLHGIGRLVGYQCRLSPYGYGAKIFLDTFHNHPIAYKSEMIQSILFVNIEILEQISRNSEQ